jgi:formylglycine-generating enzyme required for sulfatase activity
MRAGQFSGESLDWGEDCYHNSYTGAPADGSAISGDCVRRVLRSTTNPRPAWRSYFLAEFRRYYLGFRVARTL